MRKTRITVIICLVLAAGILFSGFSYLAAADKLDYSWRVHYGDIKEADGIEINGVCGAYNAVTVMRADVWRIDYTFDGNRVNMKDEAIFAEPKYDDSPSWYEISISLMGQIPGEGSGIWAAAEECYKRFMEAKEKDSSIQSVKVPLKDLFEYYPLQVKLRGGDYYFYPQDSTDGVLKKDYEDLSEFFRIPVSADDYLLINEDDIEKPNRYSDHYCFSFEPYIHSDGERPGTLYLSHAVTPKYIFLYTEDKLSDETAKAGDFPGGRGIYRLPYELHREKDRWDWDNPVSQLKTEELVNFYPLDENKKLLQVAYNEYDDSLFVVTLEEGAQWLTIVDPESGEEKQRMTLATADEVEAGMLFTEFRCEEGYFFMKTGWSRARNAVFVKNGEGEFEKKVDFTITADFLLKNEKIFSWSASIDMIYKDGRSFFLFRKLEENYDYFNHKKVMTQSGADLVLVVFNGNELSFVGEINNSLCEADYNHYTNYFLTDGRDDNIYGHKVAVNYNISRK